jgi:hypothetical protein
MAWKPDTIFNFFSSNPMYMGCSGATYLYACCITDRVYICEKICIFGSGMNKNGTSSLQRVMEGHPSKLRGVRKNLL